MDLQYLAHICCLVFLLHPTSTKKASSPHCSSTTRAEWDCLQGLSTGCIEGVYRMKMLNYCHEIFGYGSIPINTIFNGMNIHLPAILMFTRGTRFWHTATWAIHCMSIVSPGFFLGTINLWDLLMFFFSPTCGKWWTWPKKGLDSGVPYFRQPATWENWWKLWVSASLDTLVSCKAFEAWYPTFPLRSGAGSPPRWLKHRHDVSVLSSVHQNLAEP